MYEEWMYQTDSFDQPKAPSPAVTSAPQAANKPKTRKRARSLLQSVAIESKVSIDLIANNSKKLIFRRNLWFCY